MRSPLPRLLALAGLLFTRLAAEPAQLELKAGQVHVAGATYTAIIPATGLLAWLKVGDKVMIDRPWSLNLGREWNPDSRQNICASISTPETGVVVCDGPAATLRYEFGADSLTLTLTGKSAEGTRLLMTLSRLVELTWTDGKSLGPTRHAAGSRSGDNTLRAFKAFQSGQVLTIENMGIFYGPNLLRCDAARGQSFTSRWKFGRANADDVRLFLPPAAESEPLLVLSPRNYQIFQRQDPRSGRVCFAGRCATACDRLEYRVQDEWRPLPWDPRRGEFALELTMPAGGWYRGEVRAVRAGAVVATQTIEHFGVGEVFVAAGQSNSINASAERLKPASGMVATFSGEEWRLADDPQPGDHNYSRGGSFYPPLGDMLYKHYKVPIAFAVTGHGGTSVAQWQPGGDYFRWMEARLQQLGFQGFRAVLWHQGEADGATAEQEYYDRLKVIIEQSNLRAGWSFPWVVAQLGGHQTRKAKIRLWADGVALEGPDSDKLLGPENRDNNGKGAHFTGPGLRRHAALWFEKIAALLWGAQPP